MHEKTDFASTRESRYFAVIFTSARTDGDGGYAERAEEMVSLASEQPRFLGIESVRGSDELGITVSYWASDEAIRNWKLHTEHQVAQRLGRRQRYEKLAVRVAKVERAYGKT